MELASALAAVVGAERRWWSLAAQLHFGTVGIVPVAQIVSVAIKLERLWLMAQNWRSSAFGCIFPAVDCIGTVELDYPIQAIEELVILLLS